MLQAKWKFVMPAKAGIQFLYQVKTWIPACAGMTEGKEVTYSRLIPLSFSFTHPKEVGYPLKNKPSQRRLPMADEIQHQQPQPAETTVDPLILQAAIQRLRSEQNLVLAVLAGGVAALLGASVWAAITFTTSFQIGWMAVGVGFLVGYAVRIFGKGIDKSFAIVGAAWSLAGCAAGNLLSVIGVISKHQNIPFFDILDKLKPEIVASLMQATFNWMDLLFYGIAVYEGYRFSFRPITQADLMKIG
jgi:hypothetical protein